jgi:prophage tail gpP-like protein
MPKISLFVEGNKYEDWTEVRVNRSLESLCGTFSFTSADRLIGKNFRLAPLQECQVVVDDQAVMTGYIDSVDISMDAGSHTVNIRGRDKTSDLVDCSVDWPPPHLGSVDLLSLSKILCEPFSIVVKSETSLGEKFRSFEVNKGETVFEAIDRAARARGILVITNEDGELILTKAKTNRASDTLRYGENLKSFNVTHDYTNRFSKYHVYGQRPAPNESMQQIFGGSHDSKGIVIDGAITRFRPMVLSAENATTNSSAKKRAEAERARRTANSQTLSVSVLGWKQTSGILWKPNLVVACFVPPGYIDGDLLISECEWSYGSEGQVTSLELRRPDAFNVDIEPIKAKSQKDAFGGIFDESELT